MRVKWLLLLFVLLCVVAACGPESAGQKADVGSERDSVVIVGAEGQRQALPANEETSLAVGEGVDVDERGRAIVRFADLLTVEVLRDGDLVLKQLSMDEQSAFITVAQGGGVLVNDFDPQEEIERRLTVETGFATITATGTRFVVALEAGGGEAWVIGLEAGERDLEVSANGVTQAISSGKARSVAAGEAPGDEVDYDPQAVEAWLDRLRESETPLDEPGAAQIVGPAASGVILEGRGKLDRANPEAFYPFSVPGGVVLTVGVSVRQDEQGSEVYAHLYRDGTLLEAVHAVDEGHIGQEESGILTRVLNSSEGGEYELVIRRRDGSPVYEFTVSAESQEDGGQVGDAGDSRETARPVKVNAAGPYRGRLGNRDTADVYLLEVPGGVVVTVAVSVAEDEDESEVYAGLYLDGNPLSRIHAQDGGGYIEQGESGSVSRVLSDSEGGEYELVIRRSDGAPVYEFSVLAEGQEDGGQMGDAGDSWETARPIEVNAAQPYHGRLGDRDRDDLYLLDVPGGVVLTIEVSVAEDKVESQVRAGLYGKGGILERIYSQDGGGYIEQGESGVVTRVFSDREGGEYQLVIRRHDGSPVYEFQVITAEQ